MFFILPLRDGAAQRSDLRAQGLMAVPDLDMRAILRDAFQTWTYAMIFWGGPFTGFLWDGGDHSSICLRSFPRSWLVVRGVGFGYTPRPSGGSGTTLAGVRNAADAYKLTDK